MVNLIHERLPELGSRLSEASEGAHRLKAQQLAERDAAFRQLSSGELVAEVRVRRWEEVHGIRLPRTAGHPVLAVIARATGLTLLEVQTVQRGRAPQPVDR